MSACAALREIPDSRSHRKDAVVFLHARARVPLLRKHGAALHGHKFRKSRVHSCSYACIHVVLAHESRASLVVSACVTRAFAFTHVASRVQSRSEKAVFDLFARVGVVVFVPRCRQMNHNHTRRRGAGGGLSPALAHVNTRLHDKPRDYAPTLRGSG